MIALLVLLSAALVSAQTSGACTSEATACCMPNQVNVDACRVGVCRKTPNNVLQCSEQCGGTSPGSISNCFLQVSALRADGVCSANGCVPASNPPTCAVGTACTLSGNVSGTGKFQLSATGACTCVANPPTCAVGTACTLAGSNTGTGKFQLSENGACTCVANPPTCAVGTTCTLSGNVSGTGKFQLSENGACTCVATPPACAVGSACTLSGSNTGAGKLQLTDNGACTCVATPPACAIGTACTLSGSSSGAGKFQLSATGACTCVATPDPSTQCSGQCTINGAAGTKKFEGNECKCFANPIVNPPNCGGECTTADGGKGTNKLVGTSCTCVANPPTPTCQLGAVGSVCTVPGSEATNNGKITATDNGSCVCTANPTSAQCSGECTINGAAGTKKFEGNVCKCFANPVVNPPTCGGECTINGAAGTKKLEGNECKCFANPVVNPNCGGECTTADGGKGTKKLVGTSCTCVANPSTPTCQLGAVGAACTVPGSEGTNNGKIQTTSAGACFCAAPDSNACSGECTTADNTKGVKKSEGGVCKCFAVTSVPACLGTCRTENGATGQQKLVDGNCKCVVSTTPQCGGECSEGTAKGVRKLDADGSCKCFVTSTLPPKCQEGARCPLASSPSSDPASGASGVCRAGQCTQRECDNNDAQCNGENSTTGKRVCQNFRCVAAPVDETNPCTGVKCANGSKCVVVNSQRAGLSGDQAKESADAALTVGVNAAVCACASGFEGPLCENKVSTEKESCRCAAGQEQRANACVDEKQTCSCADSSKCTPTKPAEPVTPQGETKVFTVVFSNRASLLQALALVQQVLGDKSIDGVKVTAERQAGADGTEQFLVTVSTTAKIDDDLRTKVDAAAKQLLGREDVLNLINDVKIVTVDPVKPNSSASSMSLVAAVLVAAVVVRA